MLLASLEIKLANLGAPCPAEQFVEFYYKTFDDNRNNLAALYVCSPTHMATCCRCTNLWVEGPVDAHFRVGVRPRVEVHYREVNRTRSSSPEKLLGAVALTFQRSRFHSGRSHIAPPH